MCGDVGSRVKEAERGGRKGRGSIGMGDAD